MEMKEETYGDYIYVVVSLDAVGDQSLIEVIERKARGDANKVNVRAPDGIPRSKELIYWNNLGGELAQKVVEYYIDSLIKKYGINARIVPQEPQNYNYAEHRDIMVEVNRVMKTIEVRSSYNYKTSFERVLSGAFSLLATYTTSYKGYEPEKDFYITVVHRYYNYETETKLNSRTEEYIAGGASNKTFKEKGKPDNGKLKQGKANYLIINPIISVPDVPTAFKELLEIK